MKTLERAARALMERAGYTEYGPVVPPSLALELTRAALMAVLPELNRHGDEGYVYYDDLEEILNGESE